MAVLTTIADGGKAAVGLLVHPIRLVELVHDVYEHILEVPLDQEPPRLLDRLPDGVVIVEVLVLPR